MPDPIIELGVGLGAAAIIIDKVLAWTLRWKNGRNGKSSRARCIESEKAILACAQVQSTATTVAEIKEQATKQITILERMKDGGDRREDLLEKLLGAIRENNGR